MRARDLFLYIGVGVALQVHETLCFPSTLSHRSIYRGRHTADILRVLRREKLLLYATYPGCSRGLLLVWYGIVPHKKKNGQQELSVGEHNTLNIIRA